MTLENHCRVCLRMFGLSHFYYFLLRNLPAVNFETNADVNMLPGPTT